MKTSLSLMPSICLPQTKTYSTVAAFTKFLCLVVALISFQTTGQYFQDKIVSSNRLQSQSQYFAGNWWPGSTGVSIDGDYAVVGQFANNDNGYWSGAVFLYKFEPNSCEWQEVQTIYRQSTPGVLDAQVYDWFGLSVSISGTTIAIGAVGGAGIVSTNEGTVHIYEINTGTNQAILTQKITAVNNSGSPDGLFGENFGKSITLSGDQLIIGAVGDKTDENGNNTIANAGAAFIYKRISGVFQFEKKIVAPVREVDDNFGNSVGIFGNYLVVGAWNESHDANDLSTSYLQESGSAYVYEYIGAQWVFKAKLVAFDSRDAKDHFGCSVDISADYIAIGSYRDDEDAMDANPMNYSGSVYMFKKVAGNWVQDVKLTAPVRSSSDQFGTNVSLSGNQLLVGAPKEDHDVDDASNFVFDAGSAYLFTFANGWAFTKKMVAPDRNSQDQFGMSCALSSNRIIVSSPNNSYDDLYPFVGNYLLKSGAAYLFSGTQNVMSFVPVGPIDLCTWNGSLIPLSVDCPNLSFGTFSGPGVNSVNATFDPGSAGPGMHTITYDFNGTPYTMSIEVVSAPPTIAAVSPIDLCLWNGIPIQLIVSSCLGGTLSGPGVDPQAGTFDPSVAGLGNHIVTYTAGGSVASISINVFMQNQTIPSFDPVPAIDLCSWDGALIDMQQQLVCGSPTNGTFTGYGVDAQGLFDPSITGPGNHAIFYNSNGLLASILINVYEGGNWHQFTNDGAGPEEGNDIVTDAQGNVYTTGYFTTETEFNGAFNSSVYANSGAPQVTKCAYIAKYNDCGNLLWVTHAMTQNPLLESVGNALILNENVQALYVVGDFNEEITLDGSFGDSGSGGGSPQTANTSGNQGWVARLNMITGEVDYIEAINHNEFTRLTSVAVSTSSGQLFVGGYHSDNSINEMDALVLRYSPSNSSLGNVTAEIASDQSPGEEYVRDLDFDISTNRLWIVGDFDNEFNLSLGSGSVNSSVMGQSDAFVAQYNNNNVPSQNFLKQGNKDDGVMTASSISVDAYTGIAYITGSYNGQVGPVFGFSNQSLQNSDQGMNAYFTAMNTLGGNVWSQAQFADAGNGDVFGNGVAQNNGNVYFTGDFSMDNVTFSGNNAVTLPFANANPMAIVYLVEYASATGDPVWANGTEGGTNIDEHLSNAVAVGANNYAYLTGTFAGKMGYQNGSPSSGTLYGSGAGSQDMFVLRADLQAQGDLKSKLNNNELITDVSIQPEVFPNPFLNTLNVRLENVSSINRYTVVLYALDGKRIYTTTMNQPSLTMDLSAYNNGIYFLSISNGVEDFNTKVIKVE